MPTEINRDGFIMRGSVLNELQQAASQILAGRHAGYQVLRMRRSEADDRMAADVAEGLGKSGQKTLSCSYFYDAHGAELYERITSLVAYYPTRTEAALLRQVAPEILTLAQSTSMVELGSGSAAKTRILLDAWQQAHGHVTYIPIDINESMLSETAAQLASEYADLQVLGLAGHYEDALSVLPDAPDRLYLFLGGTIGNFSPAFQTMFFTSLHKHMTTGAKLLLGFDRRPHAGKPQALIEVAYNDPEGVTAAFNLNLLSHINRRLDADFDLARWQHIALYNPDLHQIEMYLESVDAQSVRVGALGHDYHFEAGERILTEVSRKFDPEELCGWFEGLGYRCQARWTDPAGLFGLALLEA